jgi:hypothetical protein
MICCKYKAVEMNQSVFSTNPLSETSSFLAPNSLTTDAYLDRPVPLPEASRQPLLRASAATSLIFIDSQVSDYQKLLAGLESGTDAYILDPVQDAVAQITQILLNYTGVSSLQIVSHGQSGALQLGKDGLNGANLNSYANELQSWKQALAPHADILLYGCDVAQSDEGKIFVRRLAELTGEDVAASDDLTGNSALGGNWNLEFKVGEITALLAFQASTLQNYAAVLQSAPVLDTSGNPSLDPITQGALNPAGTSVSALISRLGGSGITDADGDPKAIAITNVDNTNGTWQFSTNGGANWSNFGPVSATAATLLGPTSLYLGQLGTTPDAQSWLNFTTQDVLPPINTATQNFSSGGTILNSTADNTIYAGYSNYSVITGAPVNAAFPTLDRASGYSISFKLQVLSESRINSNRAGFSITAISSDGMRGIELGFQQLTGTTGNIFAQGDGITPNPGMQTNGLFLAAENASFNTNQETTYTLSVQGNTYQLFANGTQLLTGPLRNYTAFTSPFPVDPYELPSFVFLGDNTTSAQASVKLSQVVLQTDTRVRFVPNSTYSGTANLTFRAWDTTNGFANGTTNVDASTTGNATAFSTASETATITITSSNPGTPTNLKSLYLRNAATGENKIWQLNGTAYSTSFSLPTVVGAEWAIAGIADFSGDGKDDILWRNSSTGKNIIWQLNGTAYSTSFSLPTVMGAEWAVAGIADFDGDNKKDILWRNSSTGKNTIWQLNGTAYSTSFSLPTVMGAEWAIAGIADFDGDNKKDILWRNSSTGKNTIWQLNGTAYSTSFSLPTVMGAEWAIAGIADFDGDNKKDILWRNSSTGKNIIWQLNGIAYSTSFSLPTVMGATWKIQSLNDFDGDGKIDLLWRNNETARNVIWQLDYTTFSTGISLPSLAGSSWRVYS